MRRRLIGQRLGYDRPSYGIARSLILWIAVGGAIALGFSSPGIAVLPIAQDPGSAEEPSASPADPGFGAELQLGDRGEAVVQVQASLLYFGFDTGTLDGNFDAQVRAQVLRFQGMNALDATGIVDAETQRVLLTPTVADYQRRLQILGYYRDAIDGESNAAYEAAKAAFIEANTIEATAGSTLDAEFERILFSPSAIAYRP